MGLAVNAQNLTIGIEHGNAVKELRAILFIETDGHSHGQFFGDGLEMPHRRIFFYRCGIIIKIILPLLAEIGPFKEFRQQDYSGTLLRGFAYQLFGLVYILTYTCRHLHLNGGNGYFAHYLTSCLCVMEGICWVRQWKLPPPTITALAGKGTTWRSGKHFPKIRRASLSISSPNCGRMTLPLQR